MFAAVSTIHGRLQTNVQAADLFCALEVLAREQ